MNKPEVDLEAIFKRHQQFLEAADDATRHLSISFMMLAMLDRGDLLAEIGRLQKVIEDMYEKQMGENCVFCNSPNVTRHTETERFKYGGHPDPVIPIVVEVLVSGCIDCGEQWTDGSQEDVRQEAIIATLYTKYKKLKSALGVLKDEM